eukprot:290227_1
MCDPKGKGKAILLNKVDSKTSSIFGENARYIHALGDRWRVILKMDFPNEKYYALIPMIQLLIKVMGLQMVQNHFCRMMHVLSDGNRIIGERVIFAFKFTHSYESEKLLQFISKCNHLFDENFHNSELSLALGANARCMLQNIDPSEPYKNLLKLLRSHLLFITADISQLIAMFTLGDFSLKYETDIEITFDLYEEKGTIYRVDIFPNVYNGHSILNILDDHELLPMGYDEWQFYCKSKHGNILKPIDKEIRLNQTNITFNDFSLVVKFEFQDSDNDYW